MKKLILIAIVLIIGAGAGIVLDKGMPSEKTDKGGRKIAYWVAPMDPNFRRDAPGKSPMGMDLVPVYEDEPDDGGEDISTVKLTPSVINNLGVRTAMVERGPFHRQIDTVGYIDYDESTLGHVHTRAEGWIEKTYIYSVGQRVEKGGLLFEIYAPDLVNAQTEFLQALRTDNTSLIRASEERLRSLSLSERQIDEIKQNRKADRIVKVHSHHDGVITKLNAAHGMYITPADMVVETADLSSVWVLVDVFEAQSSWIKEGLPAEMRVSYEPGKIWKGKIAYVYPHINPKTRTLQVRLEFENPDEILKPDMYADVTIFGPEKPETISIPKEALIRTGDSERVILALGGGRFQPAAVTAGLEAGDRIEILEGLEAGETIVRSAQFLIDSEASFTGSTLRMSPAQAESGMHEVIERGGGK